MTKVSGVAADSAQFCRIVALSAKKAEDQPVFPRRLRSKQAGPQKTGPARGPKEENGHESLLLLGLGNLLNHFRRRSRLIHAEWLLGQEVAGGGEGASAASHADVAEFAATALPFQVVVVA